MKIIKKANYITSFSKKHNPICRINLGETFIMETNDCYNGEIYSENILRSDISGKVLNPATGPVYIKNIFSGDVICIEIGKISLNSKGVMPSYPGIGPLGDYIDEEDTKTIPIKDGYAYFTKEIKLRLNPMIGVIGVAPKLGEISSEDPGDHGGNIDTKDIKEGSKVYLPIFVEGGYLAIGDLHAKMGDGESGGMGLEIAGKVEINVSKAKIKNIRMPIIETENEFLIIASDIDFETASKKGLLYATQILQESLQLQFKDAYRLVSISCDLRVSQIVNSLVTIKVAIPKGLAPGLFE